MINPATDRQPFEIKEIKDCAGKTATQHARSIQLNQYKTLWTYIANCILALWLISGPSFYDYKSHSLTISDTISGALTIIFELLAFSPKRAVLRWFTPLIALWLLFAPLIFWSATPAVYLVDTLIASLLITFSVLIPGIPGSTGIDLPGPDQPPGWTYNPSSWIRRWLGIALALLGFFISRYLAAHQLGYIPHAWDPFFRNGSDLVTGSALSRSFPISDAGFGSVAYMMEVLTGFMGNRARWRTAPFVAVMFAILVLPLGITSIVLVIMQPIVVGAWCGLCLISAAALLASVPLAVHEAIAVGQFLVETKAQNKNFWQVFWFGGSIIGAGSEDPDRTRYSLAERWIASIRGVTLPISIITQLVIGIWLMARPDILPSTGLTANCDHVVGALVVTVAALASAEVTRIARFFNTILGGLLIILAFLFAMQIPVVFLNDLVCGILLALASIPKGPILEQYAGWNKFVR